MRNLVVCADGTWNTPDDTESGLPAPTNVLKLYNALAVPTEDKYYHTGVGTEGSAFDRLLGGGIGKGLGKNLMSAYKWLAVTYKPGDNIFLFGFSRGAFTVRSLGGMISRCGLLDLSDSALPPDEVWKRVQAAFDCYRSRPVDRKPLASMAFHNATSANKAAGSTPIHFIGVWDTVGALGIPNDLALLNLIDDPGAYAFHDTQLGANVKVARHAVAMDEMRQSFTPTLWTKWDPATDVKQIWFPGVHGDVGGGYLERGLSDGALQWMIDEATKAGLAFRSGIGSLVQPDETDFLHDSRTGIFSALKTEPRAVPDIPGGSKAFHDSALKRNKNPPLSQSSYWRTKTLKVGQSARFDVFAREHWNATGLFLEKGAQYELVANGQWVDGGIKCGPGGTKDGDFKAREVAHVAAAAFGKLESLFRRISANPQADFVGTRRLEDEDWFKLIGVVASGAAAKSPRNLGRSAALHEVFAIGDKVSYKPRGDGYLYCFANDAWHAYDNNRGSVTLTVKRIG